MMKGEEKSVFSLVPLSNAVTKLLCSVFEFCVLNTIVTMLKKNLLKRNISTAVPPNNRPPFSKGRSTLYMKPV